MKLTYLRLAGLVILVALVYFAAGQVGLWLASPLTNITPLWPPAGVAIASLFIFGRRLWPAIFMGALAVSISNHLPLPSAIGIATGNTLEALVAFSFLSRTGRWKPSFDSVSDVFRFVFWAAVAAPIIGATIGPLCFALGGVLAWSSLPRHWLAWWLGDSLGAVIVAPFILAWSSGKKFDYKPWPEIAVLFVMLFSTGMIIFGGWFPEVSKAYPAAYLSLPFLLWSALKFELRVVTSAILFLASVTVWGAAQGYGPFIQNDPNASFLLLLSFIGTSSLMTLVVFAAVSERKQVEVEKQRLGSELEIHRRRIEDIVAHVPGVVWEAWGRPDVATQRIDFVSSHVEKMLGYGEEEWLSTPNFWLTIVHPADKDRAAREAAAIFASGKGGTSRFRWLHKDGRELWVEAQSIVVLDEAGRPAGMRGVTTDISAAVRAEDERADLLRRESEARAEAEEASRLKDQFLATVSHELRTPLNAVVGWSKLLSSGQLDQEGVRHAVEVIERNAGAQRQIIDDLLDVSRIITGKLRLDASPVDLLLLVHAAIDVIRPAAAAKDIRIRTHIEAPELVVKGDGDRLQQVAWNVLANAVKFTPQGGTIDIYLSKHNSLAEIRVEDSGPGIPPEFLPRIFERFSQADGSSTRKHGGLGLGLAIVRHLVELHGGRVTAGNREENGGAVITLRLPVAEMLSARSTGRQVQHARPGD